LLYHRGARLIEPGDVRLPATGEVEPLGDGTRARIDAAYRGACICRRVRVDDAVSSVVAGRLPVAAIDDLPRDAGRIGDEPQPGHRAIRTDGDRVDAFPLPCDRVPCVTQ